MSLADAIVEALRASSAPLDKQELVPIVGKHLGSAKTAKEVNKALYDLNGRGIVKQGEAMHGLKPTWILCAAAAECSDDENRPLQPPAKRPRTVAPKEKPAASDNACVVPAQGGGEGVEAKDEGVAAKDGCGAGGEASAEPAVEMTTPTLDCIVGEGWYDGCMQLRVVWQDKSETWMRADDAAWTEGAAAAALDAWRRDKAVEADGGVRPGGSNGAAGAAGAAVDSEDDEEDRPLSSRAGASKKKAQKTAAKKGGARKESPAGREEGDEDDEDDEDEEDDAGLAVALAQAVLRAGEQGDHEAVLSAFGVAVTRESPYETLRKAYRGLAKLIHPDKLGGRFAAATKAFQCLTRAFDTLTAPEIADAGKGKGKAKPTLARSNDNCFRTKVRCPRCQSPWGGPDSGLQPYEYTHMMQGLKTYHCCMCLMQFGCMSASHSCPLCKEEIEYHPDDYHTQHTCERCEGTFGYKLYAVGPRIEAALREEVLQHQRKRHLQRDAQKGRDARRAAPPLSAAQQRKQAEKLFIQQLRHACPRCGTEKVAAEEVERRLHLRRCTDEEAHRAYADEQESMAEVRAMRAEKLRSDDEVGNLAAWRLLGGRAESAWLLTDTQLEAQCRERGLATEGHRDAQLARLAATLQAAEAEVGAPARLTEVPENLHALSLAQLASVCAAHGLAVPHGAAKDELIDLLEARTGAHGEDGGAAEARRLHNGDDPADAAWAGGAEDAEEE